MNAPREFLASLKEGNLVAATAASSSKLHLVRIIRPVTADMCRGEPSAQSLEQMFDAKPLCEVRPRFWWRPTDQHESWAADSKCRWCFSKWRAAGRPAIHGWAKTEAQLVSDIKLPWGWHEVTPSGHPLDLPADGPNPDPEENEDKVGAKRVEIKRWIRGNRYVRITQYLVDKRFAVRYGDLSDKPEDERMKFVGGYDSILVRCVTLMALGGYGGGNTSFERLTMRDVARRS